MKFIQWNDDKLREMGKRKCSWESFVSLDFDISPNLYFYAKLSYEFNIQFL